METQKPRGEAIVKVESQPGPVRVKCHNGTWRHVCCGGTRVLYS